jgi:hypothetical protein
MKENILYIGAIGVGAYLLNELRKVEEMRKEYEESTGQSSSVTQSQIMAPKVALYLLIAFGAYGLSSSNKS